MQLSDREPAAINSSSSVAATAAVSVSDSATLVQSGVVVSTSLTSGETSQQLPTVSTDKQHQPQQLPRQPTPVDQRDPVTE
jgi:hypothetical protein